MRRTRRLHFAAAVTLLAAGGAHAQYPVSPMMPPWPGGPATGVRPLTAAERAALPAPQTPGFFSGVRSFVAGSPGTTSPAPAPASAPVVRQAAAINTPRPQGMRAPTPPAQYPPAKTPGVYAGPPAYRWYGYGAVAPSPKAGTTPRGSANWYAQTGATPGAFPVTVAADGKALAVEEPPSETPGNLAASAGPFNDPDPQPKAATPPAPPPVAIAAEVPRFAPDPRQPLPVSVTTTASPPMSAPASAEPAAPERTPLPLLGTPRVAPEPTPVPVVVPGPPTAHAPAPMPATPGGPQPLMTWTSSTGGGPVAFTAARAAPPTQAAVTEVSPQPLPTVTSVSPGVMPVSFAAFAPAPAPAQAAPAAVSPAWAAPAAATAVPLGRGQKPDGGAPTLEQSVRDAAYGLAAVTEFKVTGPSKVRVSLRVGSAADAQAAADAVSKLPALKPFAVEFSATIAD
jgi:hypothetical protein